MDVAELNKLELERLHLTSDYVNTMLQLESNLNEYRLCLSKTKAIVGFSNAGASLIDLRQMDPTVRVAFDENNASYSLSNDNENNETSKVVNRSKKEVKTEKPKLPKNYKPFGELEPVSAKQARSIIEKAIALSCELASIQHKIQNLNK